MNKQEPSHTTKEPTMRVLVTGATGFIGQAVVDELVGAGHQVVGLARNQDAVAKLAAQRAQAHMGSLDDLESLKRGAAACDAVIHLAFVHDFADFAGSCAKDKAAIEAMGSVLEGTHRPLIVTSATSLLADLSGRLATRPATEDDAVVVGANPRAASEQPALAFAQKGVRAIVVRLPPTVHGQGDHQFVPHMIRAARQHGKSVMVGDGSNRWSAVHRLDAARLFRLALVAGLSIMTKKVSQVKCAPASSPGGLDTMGKFKFWPMAMAMSRIGTPSSWTAW